MKISLKWLAEYIDIQNYFAQPQELAALLTAAGIEVEGIENLAKQFEHVVVGSILKKDQHPNADRLTVCQVSTGEGVVHQIVCGARNHNAGDRVVVALPGAILPGNFSIKRSKIRDVESGGMLCSEKELGLKSEAEGILILPTNAPVGQAFAKYMGFEDILFELKVTPNRSDCLSHFGLAREIAALIGREVHFPIENLVEDGGSTQDQVALELRNSEMCPRYAGRGVRDVKVGPSPDWLRTRLESVGLKPINNVVDVTNFVMLELGQPLHAFDIRQIKGRKIIVDRAVAGESFTTLDGTEVKLDGTELTIRDAERAVALAGIVGGKNSGIENDTVEIFIESAYFTPGAVRRTARKFGIDTDSAYRFARGTNPEALLLALNRAAQLIQQVAGGKIMGHKHDQYPKPIAREAIEIALSTVEDRMGYKVEAQIFTNWMKRLGCTTEVASENARGPVWKILPPVFRWDLTVDMDLVEEYARLQGYQHIPETLPALSTMPLAHDLNFALESKIRRLLQGEGCLQAINYAFISSTYQSRILGDVAKLKSLGLSVSETPVKLVNPLNEELDVMRTALVPGLIKNVLHNSRQSNPFGRLFETGFGHASATAGDGAKSYVQESRIAFAFWGEQDTLWAKPSGNPAVFSVKGAVENLMRGLGIERWRWVQLDAKSAPDFLHPGQSARLEFEGKPIGFIGTVHPSITDEYKIRENLGVAEISLERLLQGQPRVQQYKPISKMPAVERDLAFAMPKELPSADVEAEIRKASGDLLKELRVFDVFEGGTLPAGQKSVAYRLIFQARDATLEEAKINELRDKILNAVAQKFSVSLRG